MGTGVPMAAADRQLCAAAVVCVPAEGFVIPALVEGFAAS